MIKRKKLIYRRIILPPAPEGKVNYSAGFKKPKSGKLLWVQGAFTSEKEATKELQSYVNNEYPSKGYNLYAGPLVQK